MTERKITAAPSVRRLPSYLHTIRQARQEGGEYISGSVIARDLHLEPIQVRKDLAITGIVGRPKKGYPVLELIQAIERFLGWDTVRDVALVGAGNLGMALMGYGEFKLHGLRIVIAFDQNPQKIGATIRGIPVFSIDEAETRIRKRGIKTAILTVPSGVAQDITDRLVGAGIEGIWNFTNIKLKTPPEVVVQKEDLSSGYAMLCVMMRAAE